MENAQVSAATGHLISGILALCALIVGVQWVRAGGEAASVPATLIILSLVVLTPIAMQRSWKSRGEFVDTHMQAACGLLTAVGLGAVLVIGLPALFSWLLPSGGELWSSTMVLPYLGALALPVMWAFFAFRAAATAFRGSRTPIPRWLVAGTVSLH